MNFVVWPVLSQQWIVVLVLYRANIALQRSADNTSSSQMLVRALECLGGSFTNCFQYFCRNTALAR